MTSVGTTSTIASWTDGFTADRTMIGDTTIDNAWLVSEDKVKMFDDFFAEHEAWFRKTHTLSPDADDMVSPRITSYNIWKGQVPVDPMDPTKGFVEPAQYVYIMSETYQAPTGVMGHMKVVQETWPEGLEKFGALNEHAHSLNVFGMKAICGTPK